MGFEPTTSGFEPGPLTTRSNGSLFDIVGDFKAVQFFLWGRYDRKWQFSKEKSGFAGEQNFFDECNSTYKICETFGGRLCIKSLFSLMKNGRAFGVL